MRLITPTLAAIVVCTTSARTDVVEFEDFDEWSGAVSHFTTLDFTGFEKGTFLTDQYEDLGITFVVGDDWVGLCECYLNDGWGLRGNSFGDEQIHVAFAEPITHIAADFPGFLRFRLYLGDDLVYSSTEFGGSGSGFFGGVEGVTFDEAILDRIVGMASIDDLHFGPPIPAPPAIVLLCLAWATEARRRRRRAIPA